MAVSPSSDFAPSLSAELTPVKVNVNNTVTSGIAVVALAAWPPGSPSDGQTAILELPSTYDPVGGKKVRWAFVYNSADAVWDFIGGPPLYAEVQTAETTSSTTYTDLATVGPAIGVPRGGDYIVTPGYATNAAVATWMAYSGCGVTAADVDAALGAISSSPYAGSVARSREKAGLTAGTLTAQYRAASGTPGFEYRHIAVLPVRIT